MSYLERAEPRPKRLDHSEHDHASTWDAREKCRQEIRAAHTPFGAPGDVTGPVISALAADPEISWQPDDEAPGNDYPSKANPMGYDWRDALRFKEENDTLCRELVDIVCAAMGTRSEDIGSLATNDVVSLVRAERERLLGIIQEQATVINSSMGKLSDSVVGLQKVVGSQVGEAREGRANTAQMQRLAEYLARNGGLPGAREGSVADVAIAAMNEMVAANRQKADALRGIQAALETVIL